MGDPVFFFFPFFSRITFSCYFWRFLGLGELGSFVFWLLISIVVCIRFFLCQSALLCFLGLISLFPLVSLFYFIPCGFFVSCRGLFTTNTLLDNRLLGFLSPLGYAQQWGIFCKSRICISFVCLTQSQSVRFIPMHISAIGLCSNLLNLRSLVCLLLGSHVGCCPMICGWYLSMEVYLLIRLSLPYPALDFYLQFQIETSSKCYIFWLTCSEWPMRHRCF